MDFIEGTTLERRLQSSPLSVSESLKLGVQVAQVLEYLHSQPQPVIFRDLKPANIILTPEGRPMLVDFGIARVFRQGVGQDTRALGTPGYAAPEQYGRGQSDHRTDLYALGATLHHCISGHDPGENPFQFAPLSAQRGDVPTQLEQVILRAVSLRQEDRFQSATDVRQALEGVERELGRSGVLPRSSKTTELSSQPPPPSPEPVNAGEGFHPSSIHLGKVDWGGRLRSSVILQGNVKGKLVSDVAWLKPDPAKVSGKDVSVAVYVDTRRLEEGGRVAGLVRLQGQSQVAPLRVEIEILPRKTPAWCWPSAIFLFGWSLLPVVGLATSLLMFFTAWSAPQRKRGGLSFLAWVSTFFSLSWLALVAVGVGLFHVDWKAWLHYVGL